MFGFLCFAALCLVSCSQQAATTLSRQVTEAPALPLPTPITISTQSPLGTDLDELEDDFVPYNRSRHEEFDFKLIKTVLAGKDTSNVILSPFVVKMLLSVLAEAAGKNTATERELISVLPGASSSLLSREHFGSILQSLKETNNAYDFQIATKIFVGPNTRPRQRFGSIVEKYYSTAIESIDFAQPAASSAAINQWVANETHDRITGLVQPADIEAASMIILNAIYFNGYWRRPFPINETVQALFFTPSCADATTGTTAPPPQRTTFMQQTGTFYYLESAPLDAKLLRLPYKGRRFSMTLLLPNSADTPLDTLLARLDSDKMRQAQYYMDEVEVRVQMPKFRFDHTAALGPVLESLGIRSIFTAEASLPLLARGTDTAGQLQVSKVLQKAGIEVTEKGSTAYAATEVVLTNKFGGDSTQEFIANRPFVFLIEDERTGALLFAGKVTNPAEFAGV